MPHPMVERRAISPAFFAALLAPGYRASRVGTLLCGIVLLSLADLYMTLVHLLNFGMLEANPVARSIMQYGSPAALIIWKLITVGMAVGILFFARHRRLAEWAALFCCGVLVWLTGRWVVYNMQVGHWTADMHAIAGVNPPGWVTMAGE
jgi:hypothetical protein